MRYFIVLLLLLIIWSANSNGAEVSREECIVRVDIEWLVEDSFEQSEARNALAQALAAHFSGTKRPLDSLGISKDGEEWLFQFRQRCDVKEEIVKLAFQDPQVLPLLTSFRYRISP